MAPVEVCQFPGPTVYAYVTEGRVLVSPSSDQSLKLSCGWEPLVLKRTFLVTYMRSLVNCSLKSTATFDGDGSSLSVE